MSDRPSVAILAPTPRGLRLAQQIQAGLPGSVIWTKDSAQGRAAAGSRDALRTYEDFRTLVADRWTAGQPLIFVLAVGATVRAIAPHLQDKRTEPAVVAVDETGQHVISLCGGHLGGADALTRQVAGLLAVEPVITSAAEGQQLPAIDLLGDRYGWRRGQGDWLGVASAIARFETVGVVQTCGWNLWIEELPEFHPFVLLSEADLAEVDELPSNLRAIVWISDRPLPPLPLPAVAWHPRTLWVGIGCERHTPEGQIAAALAQVLEQADLAPEALAGIGSIDLKRDEVGLLALVDRLDLSARWFTAAALAPIAVPNPSEVVRAEVGTPSVAEAAARLAADGAELIRERQGFRAPNGGSGACTIALARADREYTPHLGKLWLIGTGPGSLDQLTPAARAALSQCDVIIGYQLCLDLLRPLLHPGQIIEGSPITHEKQRAERAIDLAERGLRVAVVSSGDCGIDAMAGLVLECLAARNWDGQTPQVEVLPGITALQAAAARVGAPLMHDFCAISLSDLLTPWPVIVQRLQAAAAGDFVVALYNPRSQTRQTQIETAFEIFRAQRSPETPVILARSLHRPDEQITIATLATVDLQAIDMLTVVLIGNASTFTHSGKVITPRGYAVANGPLSATAPATD